eukprot:403334541
MRRGKRFQEDDEIDEQQNKNQEQLAQLMYEKMEKMYGSVYNDLLTQEDAVNLQKALQEADENGESDEEIDMEYLQQMIRQQSGLIDINEDMDDVEDIEGTTKALQGMMMNRDEVDQFIEEAEYIIDEIQKAEDKLFRLQLGLVKQIKCQYCEYKGPSIIEERNSTFAFLLAIIIIILMGWFGVLLTPFCFGIMRQQIHRCSKCLNAVKEKSLFSSLEDNIGKFGIIIKRRTLAKTLLFLVMSFVAFYLFKFNFLNHDRIFNNYKVDTTISWNSFLTDCGKQLPIEQAREHFFRRYKSKHVQWYGYVMRVDANEQSELHFAKILIQMDPRDTHPQEEGFGEREPDIILAFDEKGFERNQAVLEELRRGDYILFNATITQLGVRHDHSPGGQVHGDLSKYNSNDEVMSHHMHAMGVKKIRHAANVIIEPHYHWDGRFQFNQDMQNKDFDVDSQQYGDRLQSADQPGHHHH